MGLWQEPARWSMSSADLLPAALLGGVKPQERVHRIQRRALFFPGLERGGSSGKADPMKERIAASQSSGIRPVEHVSTPGRVRGRDTECRMVRRAATGIFRNTPATLHAAGDDHGRTVGFPEGLGRIGTRGFPGNPEREFLRND